MGLGGKGVGLLARLHEGLFGEQGRDLAAAQVLDELLALLQSFHYLAQGLHLFRFLFSNIHNLYLVLLISRNTNSYLVLLFTKLKTLI